MAAESTSAPLGLDPLIAEAKRRTRRRRALVLALLVAVAAGAVSLYFDLRAPSGAPLGVTSPGASTLSPVVPSGGSFGAVSGFMGDSDRANRVTTLGCSERRQYEQGFGLRNRSHAPVTVLGVKWRSPAPRMIQLVATQFRLALYQPGVDEVINRNWSSRPSGPVVLPRRRELTVETDFLFKHCGRLAGGRTVTVPGSFTIRYRAQGVVRTKVVKVPAQAFVLGAGPKRRTCAMGLVSANTSCADAQKAALACHEAAVTFVYCKAAGTSWLCDRTVPRHGAPYVESCDEDIKVRSGGDETRPHGFRVRWNAFTRRT